MKTTTKKNMVDSKKPISNKEEVKMINDIDQLTTIEWMDEISNRLKKF